MIKVQKNVDLTSYNTMKVSSKARFLVHISTIDELREAVNFAEKEGLEILALGSGSNLLFVHDFEGLIIVLDIQGFEIDHLDETNEILLRVGAGQNWHELVLFCVERNWGGIENLSLIPGTVGAAPIQNIGAYGVELQDVFVELEVFDISRKEMLVFTHADCEFGYRNSIFKNELKGKVIITSVTLKLMKDKKIDSSYAALSQKLNEWNIEQPSIKDVSEAVIAVRQSKLPDPSVIGNNGSFFKNPLISITNYKELKVRYPEMPSYPVSDNEVKIPAGWLIDKAGWKGFRKADAGVHSKQALVLVNHGEATGKDIYNLSEEIKQDISIKYGIHLEREVNIL